MSAVTLPAVLPSVTLPPALPPTSRRFRTPKKNIPQTKPARDALLKFIRDFVEREKPVPPLPSEELKDLADRVVRESGLDPAYRDYAGVLLNNEIWRESLATIPYERRLLLMPKCLRVESKCPAPFDEFGLLCKQCGLCTIQDFQNEAERLGYAVLVAEGSAIVMSLIQTGKIEAIVGISCLPVLERTFPYVEAAAIPAVAVPLLQDDCIDTTVDIDWVWDYLHLTSEDRTRRLNLNALHDEVRTWFTPESLTSLMGPAEGQAEEVARVWLAGHGNRWRPFLTVAVSQALRENAEAPFTDSVKKLAIAVECFHKASLIHDDIEDGDAERYDVPALHTEQGLAIALNAGDLLIGEGYRLIAECGLPAATLVPLIRIAAQGQRELCQGQGAELAWQKNPAPLTSGQVLEIFRLKTAPAFSVALLLGAAHAGRLDEVEETLRSFSEALGIAYQIKDDLDDFTAEPPAAGAAPSVNLVSCLTTERFGGDQEKARNHAGDLLDRYKEQAIRSLQDLDNPNLKGLMRRVVGKIFTPLEVKGWCHTEVHPPSQALEVQPVHPEPALAAAV
ncbi:MAG: polyprenyl synthetase family protein [Verrucomicrobiota bacterium]